MTLQKSQHFHDFEEINQEHMCSIFHKLQGIKREGKISEGKRHVSSITSCATTHSCLGVPVGMGPRLGVGHGGHPDAAHTWMLAGWREHQLARGDGSG